jgi:hypothetical protein
MNPSISTGINGSLSIEYLTFLRHGEMHAEIGSAILFLQNTVQSNLSGA